ncbi:PEP-CTERM sorting domain-containing protein [Luteolibacter luteus]|uniref:PEP-CTERM sorting domain-containing protein n=1 Tax=Luteolibacter luteus TaxID=2728835 RepID=A0A858RP21_9BACT|nr:PEP-CTERM sorting domain-containing protein [Luteolibacter luteus]QJE98485.1 PEP-CTERM sorting domain-containing protein [Luteolibacter luteus]
MGTIQVTSFGGGSGEFFPTNPESFGGLGYSVTDTTLSNGDTLHLDSAIVFSPHNASAASGGLSGFSITFTLDSGTFAIGDVFGAGSLDYRSGNNRHTYFQPGSSFGGVESGTIPVPADGSASLLPVAGTEGLANGPLYTATGGTSELPLVVSGFGFFRLTENTNSFTTYFTSTGSPQGVALTFAVPEPSGALLGSVGGVMLLLRRRKRSAR